MAIKVNLLPREVRPKRAAMAISLGRPSIRSASSVVLIGTAVLVLAVLGVAIGYYMALSERADLKKNIARLQEEDKALKLKLTELELAKNAKREIERRIEIIARVAKSQKVPVTMMNGVLTAVPEGIWLTAFDMKPQEVQVQVEGKRPAIAYSSETLKALEEKKQEAAAPAGGRGAKPDVRTVTELRGFSVTLRGMAFNNVQVASFMENLLKVGFTDVDFTVTQATNIEQVRVMSFELTASVKL